VRLPCLFAVRRLASSRAVELVPDCGHDAGMARKASKSRPRAGTESVAEEPRYDLSELLAGITKDNLHPEIDMGDPVGAEFPNEEIVYGDGQVGRRHRRRAVSEVSSS
jgi:hypothetical protein